MTDLHENFKKTCQDFLEAYDNDELDMGQFHPEHEKSLVWLAIETYAERNIPDEFLVSVMDNLQSYLEPPPKED
jgi:hypothetical protein